MMTIEELLEYKNSGSGLEKTEINVGENSLRSPRNTLYPQRLALTSPTCGGRSVGIILLQTAATEFSFFFSDSVLTWNPLKCAVHEKQIVCNF
jgi:hypothetical protein